MNNIDSTLTVKVPYSEDDITVFGANAGQQCIAMSLCALIYNNIKGINTCNDLVQIMEMGNKLYSTLSQCTGQVYLMQTELPSMIAMSEKNYQLNYSESYTGNLHNSDSIIEGYQYSIPIDSAFESLLSQNYSSFILTMGCIGVSIYHTDNGSYQIFDSYARDQINMVEAIPILEVPSIQGLVQYFQAMILSGTHVATARLTILDRLVILYNVM